MKKELIPEHNTIVACCADAGTDHYYDRKSQLMGIAYGDYAIAYTYDKLGNRITVEQG